jgi:hypothetical protein
MPGGDRSQADGVLAAAIAAGLTYVAAAERAGVSERTARRRMSDNAFRLLVERERSHTIDAVRGRLVAATVDAAETLHGLCLGAESESVRASAARALLDLAFGRRGEFSRLSLEEFKRMIGQVIDFALDEVPDERHEAFLNSVEAYVASRL